ncbi:MAG TPA: hypothetical protein VM142_08795 [Acidimicrobiales bacterium]|nr:hypothetical protein [Acidimicrobiales bacterium]
MPWCESCSRYIDPPAEGIVAQCPGCGQPAGAPEAEPKAPWHFKLLVAATIAYLAFRAYQGVLWLLARL